MKKTIIISCTIASMAIIFDSIGAWHMIMMFLFVGIIPGTNNALSPMQMLALMSTLACAVIIRAGVMPIIRKIKTMNVKQSQITVRNLKRA